MIFSDKKILIISPEPWGVNHISKHHYALALIKKGNTVYFLKKVHPATARPSKSACIS